MGDSDQSPATSGLTIAEGKAILASLQTRGRGGPGSTPRGQLSSAVRDVAESFRTKGYYRSTLRAVYGEVPMRVGRRIGDVPARVSQERSYSTIFTNKYPITPELRYLTAKMAALLPFGRASRFFE